MCLALPAKIIALDETGENATISLEGIRKVISIALLDKVKVGDYVLDHVGYALARLSEDEALKTLNQMAGAEEKTNLGENA